MTELPDWAEDLELRRHPEGGWYRETWRSDVEIPQANLPDGYPSARAAGTAILYLLLPGEQSAWHTVRGTEIWLYHRGSPVRLEVGGTGPTPVSRLPRLLGPDIANLQRPQHIVPPSHWQRATPIGDEASLVSCIVTPGFDFDDFALQSNDG